MSIQIIIKVKKINGTSFVGVRNYTNKYGEVSNQTFLVGFSYANMLKKDLEKLTSFALKRQVVAMFANNDKQLVKKAYMELVGSLEKRTASEEEKEKLRANNDSTIKSSDSQKKAYTNISKGLKAKNESLYIYGLCVRKKVLVKGNYPKTNRQQKTIVKNTIKNLAMLRGLKYKNFQLGKLEEMKLNL